MFYLGRNESLPLRIAQVRTLLARGLRPERIIFVLLPIDFPPLATQPLSSIRVTARGALMHEPRMPRGPAAYLVNASAVAQLAWIRSGRHVHDPGFRARDLMRQISPSLARDSRTLLVVLRDEAATANAELTVLVVPNREQVFGTGGFALQDTLATICAEERIDYADARHFLSGESNPRSFFLPDWHFNPEGNRRLLAFLLMHLERESPQR